MIGPNAGKGAGRTVPMSPMPVSLKELAEHLDLSPATVSLVINRSPVADSIPQETKDRILAAVKKYKYRPNFFARSLRKEGRSSQDKRSTPDPDLFDTMNCIGA